jgi:hypothetical protein
MPPGPVKRRAAGLTSGEAIVRAHIAASSRRKPRFIFAADLLTEIWMLIFAE